MCRHFGFSTPAAESSFFASPGIVLPVRPELLRVEVRLLRFVRREVFAEHERPAERRPGHPADRVQDRAVLDDVLGELECAPHPHVVEGLDVRVHGVDRARPEDRVDGDLEAGHLLEELLEEFQRRLPAEVHLAGAERGPLRLEVGERDQFEPVEVRLPGPVVRVPRVDHDLVFDRVVLVQDHRAGPDRRGVRDARVVGLGSVDRGPPVAHHDQDVRVGKRHVDHECAVIRRIDAAYRAEDAALLPDEHPLVGELDVVGNHRAPVRRRHVMEVRLPDVERVLHPVR